VSANWINEAYGSLDDDVCEICQTKCPIAFSNGKVTSNLTVDRIDSSKPHIKDNARLLCTSVTRQNFANEFKTRPIINFSNSHCSFWLLNYMIVDIIVHSGCGGVEITNVLCGFNLRELCYRSKTILF